MKYRRLSMEELTELEPEFVRFLATQSVPAKEWEKLKQSHSPKVDAFIESFSDMVLEKVLQKVQYVEQRTSRRLCVYWCRKNDMRLAVLEVNPQSGIDLLNEADLQQLAQGKAKPSDFGITLAHRIYEKQREPEVFDLLQNNGKICDGKLFELLASLK